MNEDIEGPSVQDQFNKKYHDYKDGNFSVRAEFVLIMDNSTFADFAAPFDIDNQTTIAQLCLIQMQNL